MELALRRKRLILRSERIRFEISLRGTALQRRLERFDQITAIARKITSKSVLMTIVSAVLYFSGSKRPMRFIGRGLMWVSMAKRVLNLYRTFVPRQR